MSRVRKVGALVLAAAIAVGAAGCSKDEKKPEASDRKTITFSDAPEGSTTLGLCHAYDIDKIKAIIGGDEHFQQLAPAAIGQKGDAVTGEACAWQRNDLNGDTRSLHIEVRNFGKDAQGLKDRYDELLDQAQDPARVPGVGDAAFTTAADDATVMQVRTGSYLLTLSSQGSGKLEPVSTDTLTLLAALGVKELP